MISHRHPRVFIVSTHKNLYGAHISIGCSYFGNKTNSSCMRILNDCCCNMSTAPGAIGGAYGAGKAGAPFDPLTYIKKPQVILRLVSLVSKVFFLIRFPPQTACSTGLKGRLFGHWRPTKSRINTTLMSFLCFIVDVVGVFDLFLDCSFNKGIIL